MLNEGKCFFAASEIDFLGYHVTANGVYPKQDNIEAVRTLPTPSSAKELASFLGTTNFYLKFVPNDTEVADPLRKLMRKDVPWEWTHTQQHAFVTLKEKVTSPPVLTHFNPNAKTTVTTDASGTAVGAVLSQWITGGE